MINQFETSLKNCLDALKDSQVKEAMKYTMLSGGKRLRPSLVLAFVEDLGGDMQKALYPAIALELIHNYSLVHDDLPSMDDDDYRRHRLTAHKVYGEALAILSGDALLTMAFDVVLKADLSPEQSLACVEILSRNAGVEGMVYGQELDIANEMESLDDLLESYRYKTGKLFAAAFELGTIVSGYERLQKDAKILGETLGVYFQIQDDLLEHTQSFEEIGKHVDSDEEEGKVTVVSILGLEEAQKLLLRYEEKLKEQLALFPFENNRVEKLIEEISQRSY